ncbi:hypothetical protein [Cognatishimia sp. MH4019]|uniref:hypothetical protein n=1 Tax=Cognatishimia sp. MH4019 TaxID=2854030 RepID=UPI001CD6CE8F|nr:hypothetical protein [Cognatishimia sp. MH4019]
MLHVAPLNSAVLPVDGPRRDHIVEAQYRPEGYDAGYDFSTLWYDAIWDGRDVVLTCPRLLNLARLFKTGTVLLDALPAARPRISTHRRHDIVRINAPLQPAHLSLRAEDMDLSTPIMRADWNRFRGKNVHLAISRDNDLIWLKDFAQYHIVEHGLQAMIVIDNGSTAYTPEELAQTLLSTGLEDVLILPAPFAYGPFGLKPFSRRAKFLQTALLNAVRMRYLSRARAVLNCDIDELVWSKSGSIFDLARKSLLGAVTFPGIWRFPVEGHEGFARHRDHLGIIEDVGPCPPKSCIVPTGPLRRLQWDVHGFELPPLARLTRTSRAGYWHFRAISTNWKQFDRLSRRATAPDPDTVATLARVFPE